MCDLLQKDTHWYKNLNMFIFKKQKDKNVNLGYHITNIIMECNM